MEEHKKDRLVPFQDELESSCTDYRPFGVSCWERLHPSASQVLQGIARHMSRSQGSSGARVILGRLRARVAAVV